MCQFINVLLVAFVICSAPCTSGYKWVTLKTNETIPKDAIKLKNTTYVGRAVHYNLVLPAEVFNSSFALVLHNSEEIVKRQFQVLTANESCEWKSFSFMDKIPPNVVPGGSTWNKEPIYIGRTTWQFDNNTHIALLLIESNRYIVWSPQYWEINALTCAENATWTETLSGNLSKNAVSGGLNYDGTEYYVGRLLCPSTWVPGRITPRRNTTVAECNGYLMTSNYTQVLLGSANQYKWQTAEEGSIPDYAVVGGQAANGELRYVVKLYNDPYGLSAVPSELRARSTYDVLVRNL